jgi:DNA repair exonuclease SbcCD ATPase subunit
MFEAMRSVIWAIAAAALLAACDSKSERPAGAAPAGAKKQAAGGAPAAQAADPQEEARRQARMEELRAKVRELAAKVKEREGLLESLDTKHSQEKSKLGQISKMRRPYKTAKQDLIQKQSQLDRLDRRLQELEKSVGEASSGKLNELQKQKGALEKEYEAAVSFKREETAGAAAGQVEESPVKKDLDLLRAIKHKWFEMTAEARRERLPADKAKGVSNGFRTWLAADNPRGVLVNKVLKQDLAPKGKNASNFDFTDLDFYILLEVLENELDKQNVAVEKKELSELGVKVRKLQKELDAVNAQIADFLVAEGGDLSDYEDLKSRRKGLKTLRDMLETRVGTYAQIMGQFRAIQERQDEERRTAVAEIDEATAELDKAKKELRDL